MIINSANIKIEYDSKYTIINFRFNKDLNKIFNFVEFIIKFAYSYISKFIFKIYYFSNYPSKALETY